MPNHVQNVLKVSGPDAYAAMGKYWCKLIDPETDKPYGPTFDFNTLVPMPAIALKVVENGISADVLSLLARGGSVAETWQRLRHFDKADVLGPWKGLSFFEKGEIERRLEQCFPGCIGEARAMALCIGETGYKSWYDWSIANWGTKWNAYDATFTGEGDAAELRFETAWSVPLPILVALAKAEPALTFSYWAFDEGWNFYATGSGAKSEFSAEDHRSPSRDDDAAMSTYRICYGSDPEPEEDAA